ncbi:MAG: substrate-binding domain-containing protein [Mucinivorans sp.]
MINLIKIMLLGPLMALMVGCGATSDFAPWSDGSVALLFPADDNPRWLSELNSITLALGEHDYEVYVDISNDVQQQVEAIQSVVDLNLSSMVLVSLDPHSKAINQALAQVRGGGTKIICYERLQEETPDVDLFIACDGHQIGRMEGKAVAELPRGGRIEILSGGANDLYSKELFEGMWSCVQQNVSSGLWSVPSGHTTMAENSVGGWSKEQTMAYFQNILHTYYADGSLPDAILTSSDLMAQGVVEVITALGDRPYPIITGQGNSKLSRQLILKSQQTMTVDKNPQEYIKQTIRAINQYSSSLDVATSATKNNGLIDVPMVVIPAEVVYQSNIL